MHKAPILPFSRLNPQFLSSILPFFSLKVALYLYEVPLEHKFGDLLEVEMQVLSLKCCTVHIDRSNASYNKFVNDHHVQYKIRVHGKF